MYGHRHQIGTLQHQLNANQYARSRPCDIHRHERMILINKMLDLRTANTGKRPDPRASKKDEKPGSVKAQSAIVI
jgi:hypothetical protein